MGIAGCVYGVIIIIVGCGAGFVKGSLLQVSLFCCHKMIFEQ